MSDERKTGRVQTVMAPGDLRATDHGPFPRRSRRDTIRRVTRPGLEADGPRPKAAAMPAGGRA